MFRLKSKYLPLATLCLSLALLIVFLAKDALGHHYRYLAQDEAVQQYRKKPGMPKNVALTA